MERGRALLAGRVLWNVNSTARGGGVAEMLSSLVPYFRGVGIDCRWVVIEGSPEFFKVTKRVHNNLHGELGDGGELGAREHAVYERTLSENARELLPLISRGDVVLLHDPQTAGLARIVKEAGALPIWRCHVGLDTPNHIARRAWEFLRPFLLPVDAYVFSRRAFVWEGLRDDKIWVIAPSIDAFSPKNQELLPEAMNAILSAARLLDVLSEAAPTFTRLDGTVGHIERRAGLVSGGRPPPSSARLVVQVSRWDRLKDPLGVIEGFARYVAGSSDAHLVVAGPDAEGVGDDPEGPAVLREALGLWRELPADIRPRVHLVTLPMEDVDENGAMVNALQRRSDVIVQKSLAEGFGLTVAEAMWKGRPVVASRIGGIQDQVIDGVSGILITNPANLASFGEVTLRLLKDPKLAARLGREARTTVAREFLHPRQMVQQLKVVERLIAGL
jgi:trehalose synthase